MVLRSPLVFPPCKAGLEQDARQPRLAIDAGVISDKKTCERTEDAATDRVMNGDNSSAQVDHDPMCLASFRDDFSDSLALPRRDDVLVDKDASAPKPCLSPVEMRTLTAAGGLLPAGSAPTARCGPSFPDRFFMGASVKRPRKKVPAGQITSLPPWLEEGYPN